MSFIQVLRWVLIHWLSDWSNQPSYICVDGKEGGWEIPEHKARMWRVEERCLECGVEGILNGLSMCVVMDKFAG